MDTCHCGSPLNGSDHCSFCLCEQFEATCEMRYRETEQDDTFYGACGVEGCTDCRPLFDADNNEIPNSDGDAPMSEHDYRDYGGSRYL